MKRQPGKLILSWLGPPEGERGISYLITSLVLVRVTQQTVREWRWVQNSSSTLTRLQRGPEVDTAPTVPVFNPACPDMKFENDIFLAFGQTFFSSFYAFSNILRY